MRTFIHHSGALGDVILSLPCIQAARELSSSVHLAGRADVVRLLMDTGWVDEGSSSDDSLYAPLYGMQGDESTAGFLSRFERALIFSTKGHSEFSAVLTGIIPITKTIMTIPPAGTGEHAADFRLKQLGCPGTVQGCSLLIEIPRQHERKAEELLGKASYPFGGTSLIGLHYGSGGKRKCWPLENYLDLAGRVLQGHDSFVLIFSGPAEDTATKEKIGDFARRHDNVLHVRDRELTTVAALLGICTLFVGNDSGISHLAGAVNIKVIALFGPTDPHIWRPLGQNVRVISSEAPDGSLSGITVDRVYGAVTDVLS